MKQWSINSQYPQAAIMPNVDHTKQSVSGHYLYIVNTINSGIASNEGSMRATENLVDRRASCISLWYYMRTSIEVQLSITILNQNVSLMKVVRTQDHGEKWNQLSVNFFPPANSYQIMISGLVYRGM